MLSGSPLNLDGSEALRAVHRWSSTRVTDEPHGVDVLRRTSRKLSQMYPLLKAVIAPSAARSSGAVTFRVAAPLSFDRNSYGCLVLSASSDATASTTARTSSDSAT